MFTEAKKNFTKLKKTILFLLVMCLSLSVIVPLNAFAEEVVCGATVSGSECLIRGETAKSTVTIYGCSELSGTYANGVLGASFVFTYDETVFSYDSYTANIPDNWESFSTEAADGKITVFLAWDGSGDDVDSQGLLNGVSADGVLTVDVNLKVLSTASFASETTVSVSDVFFTNGSFKNIIGAGSEYTTTVVPIYSADADVAIDSAAGVITGIDASTTYSEFFDIVKSFSEQTVLYDADNNVITSDYTGYIGTGFILKVVGGRTDGYTVLIKGDINSDGVVSASDYAAVKSYFKGNISLPDIFVKAADMNSNGVITTTDYIAIMRNCVTG